MGSFCKSDRFKNDFNPCKRKRGRKHRRRRPDADPIGVDVVGNGTLTGEIGGEPGSTISFAHDDFDDWNPLLELESPNNILDPFGGTLPGTPDLPNPGTATEGVISFDSIDLELLSDLGSGLFSYAAAAEDGFIDYNFGEITAEVDTTGNGFANEIVTDDLLIRIPNGTQFIAEDLGGGATQLIIDADSPLQPYLIFGDNSSSPSTTGDLTLDGSGIDGQWSLGTFEYENQFNPFGPIGDYSVNFTTKADVLDNPPAPVLNNVV